MRKDQWHIKDDLVIIREAHGCVNRKTYIQSLTI